VSKSGLLAMVEKLWDQLGRRMWSANFTIQPNLINQIDKPILSAKQIADLAEELSHLSVNLHAHSLSSEALRQGEQTSRFMGAGLEYEESRHYQMGDEIRRINWRLMAKTGQAFTKLYQEERQEHWFIVLDHRQTMRFGTRTRLKAEQAIRVAGYYLWMAQRSNTPVEGVRMAEELTFTPTFEGRATYEQLMTRFSQPCPPIKRPEIEPHINDVLLDLIPRTQPGSRIILISDFHDMNAKSVEILTALQQLADIQAIWIQDPAEVALPNQAGIQLRSMVNAEQYELKGVKNSEAYQAWSEAYFQEQHTQLQTAGVQVKRLQSDAPLSQLQATETFDVNQGGKHGR